MTPAETPNITLHLGEPATLTSYFGITRRGAEILLYVDDPARFAAAAAEARMACHG